MLNGKNIHFLQDSGYSSKRNPKAMNSLGVVGSKWVMVGAGILRAGGRSLGTSTFRSRHNGWLQHLTLIHHFSLKWSFPMQLSIFFTRLLSKCLGHFKDQIFSQRQKSCYSKSTQENETQACWREHVETRKQTFHDEHFERDNTYVNMQVLTCLCVSLITW